MHMRERKMTQERLIVRFIPDRSLGVGDDDCLGRSDIVNRIVEMLRYTEAPFTFGLLGGWGTGKSSLLSIINQALEVPYTDEGGVLKVACPVLFEAWRYEREESLFPPMLHSLLRKAKDMKLDIASTDKMRKRFFRIAGATLLSVADWGLQALTSKASSGEASISLEDIKKHFETVEDEWGMRAETWIDEIERSREMVSDYVKEFQTLYSRHFQQAERHASSEGAQLKPADVRVVYLIDDLDRCSPDAVVDLIERLKNFCASSDMVQLIAVNPEILERSIKVKYPTLSVDGRKYLEKIINHSFPVPCPSPDKLQQFCEWQMTVRIENLEKLSADSRRRINDAAKVFGRTVITLGLVNPRKIWRIANKLALALEELWMSRTRIGDFPWLPEPIILLTMLAEEDPREFRELHPLLSDQETDLHRVRDGHEVRELHVLDSPLTPVEPEQYETGYMRELRKRLHNIFDELDESTQQALYELILGVSDMDAETGASLSQEQ